MFVHIYVGTLGSILDSQLSGYSGKFQITRWSHRVALFLTWTTPTQPKLSLFLQCCVVSPPHLLPHQQSMSPFQDTFSLCSGLPPNVVLFQLALSWIPSKLENLASFILQDEP